MEQQAILEQLENLALTLGVKIRYEKGGFDGTDSTGGLIRLMGEDIIIVNSNAFIKDKIETFARALLTFDLSQVFIRPGLREFLDEFE